MGLLDLPGPLLGWIDVLLTGIPAWLRLVLWGAAGGALSMLLYRAISPQARIASSKQEQLKVRSSLDEFDGELADAWPLIRRLLGLSLGHVGRVLGPAVVASVPVLCLLVWMSTAYGHVFPERETPTVRVAPAPLQARWQAGTDDFPSIVVTDAERTTVADVPVPAPVTVIEKWRWWNLLIGNPAGYLDSSNPAQRLEIDLPRRQYLSAGPGWMRGWEIPFFTALIIASLLLKRVFRIN
jgi:hypothetical protein